MHRTLLLLACLATACNQSPDTARTAGHHRFVAGPTQPGPQARDGAKALRVAGCGAGAAILAGALDAWSESGPGSTLVTTRGETAGLTAVATGKADAAVICRPARPQDKRRGLRFLPLGWGALAVTVHPDNPVADIATEDLCAILRGDLRDWTELGVETTAPGVRPLGLLRSEDGDTQTVRNLLNLPTERHFPMAQRFRCPTELLAALAETPGAIAICDANLAHRAGLRLVALDGVAPTGEAVQSGRYPLRRQVFLALPRHPSPAARDLAAFLRGKGQEMLTLQRGPDGPGAETDRPATPPAGPR